jgi:hypothetical protein
MAISDMKGTVTTTGMMNKGPAMPKGKVDPKLPQAEAPKPQVATKVNTEIQGSSLKEQFPDASDTEIVLAERFKKLTAEDRAAISAVLSPSVTSALSKMLPEFEPVMKQIGSKEPNVVLPVSIVSNYAVKRYGGSHNEALAVFMEDVSGQMETQQTTNVPPSQPTETPGLMTSPQNMETV